MSRVNRTKRIKADLINEPKKNFKTIQALNDEQREYIRLIHSNDIIICTGKAGSGKTAIASGIAAEYLYNQKVEKIVLTRPCVGAENLGFLPGDGTQKISPYLMPLFTELSYFCDVSSLIKQDKVLISPLAYMRGVTLKDSIILADESQNADDVLLKLLLTRLGEGSKMIVTGDITQSDLNKYKDRPNDFFMIVEKVIKPLAEAGHRIAVINLEKSVRHPLVELISNQFEAAGYK